MYLYYWEIFLAHRRKSGSPFGFLKTAKIKWGITIHTNVHSEVDAYIKDLRLSSFLHQNHSTSNNLLLI